jgi:hypothetical protein
MLFSTGLPILPLQKSWQVYAVRVVPYLYQSLSLTRAKHIG